MEKLKWCNVAHTGKQVHEGDFEDGDAHWLGYVECAKHIALNQDDFCEEDKAKAKSILRSTNMPELAERIKL